MRQVFYLRSKFKLIEWKTIWLSQTPDKVGSRGWDAAFPRIATIVRLRHLDSGKYVSYINTHFDHKGEVARKKSSRLILELASKELEKNEVFMLGDFNSHINDSSYKILVNKDSSMFRDSFHLSHTEPKGPQSTHNDWLKPKEGRIDYIFSPKGSYIKSHNILMDRRDGRFLSDHMPLLVKSCIK